MAPFNLLVTVVILAWAGGCQNSPSGLATVKMQIGKNTFTLEVADTEATREHGLMERDSMPQDHGMIFVFGEERELDFWMKNTRFPLDILYVDAGGKVVSIKQMKPYDLGTTPSDYPAKYAIELNLGAAADAHVHVGDKISIPAGSREPKEK
ncbi:MAG TPA: DUF192 domain-containing protein [Humisphaera sp.]|jgi:hypothetical protein|nr:DUF192 domain-containing protein [Humisphaera sp.]